MVSNVSKLPSRLMEVKKKSYTDLPTLFVSEPLAETSNLFFQALFVKKHKSSNLNLNLISLTLLDIEFKVTSCFNILFKLNSRLCGITEVANFCLPIVLTLYFEILKFD